MVCRFNPALFIARMKEVRGLSFDNAPRVPANGAPVLPTVIPFIDHRYGRASALKEPVVALSLYEVVNMATGKLHCETPKALSDRFLIPDEARIVLSGVDQDNLIERWWELSNRNEILSGLQRLGVTLVTSPNYSVLSDVPRTDNLHAMKRILLAWTEMARAGLASALHVNGRTEQDYFRWGKLIAERDEIENLAFEFATGCGQAERIDWHIEQLCQLADRVPRRLTLSIRGGGRMITRLSQHFGQVSLIETEGFNRTMYRKKAHLLEPGRIKWSSFPTAIGAPLDDLLTHNISTIRAYYDGQAGIAKLLK